MMNHRCYICNAVSSMEIETNVGDFKNKNFILDMKEDGYMCQDCKEDFEKMMLSYQSQDDIYGWMADNDNEEEEPLVIFFDDKEDNL